MNRKCLLQFSNRTVGAPVIGNLCARDNGPEFASTNRAAYADGKVRLRCWRPERHASRGFPTKPPPRKITSNWKAVPQMLEICRDMTTSALICCKLRHLGLRTSNYS